MAVFARTEEGQDAAYSPQSALPRKLKSILKVIDGRTTMATFEQNLSSFGDVQAILQSLQMAGLIKQIEHDPVRAAGKTGQRTELPTLRMPTAPIASDDTALLAQWANTRNASSEQSNSVDTQAWHASEMAVQMMPQVRQQHSAALQDILDTMSNFVLTHLPGQSFQILREIEEITSLELLAVTLGGYEQMVASVGEPSVLHLKSIKQTLRDNL